MGEKTTITVYPETLDRFNEVRGDMDHGDLPEPSADTFLNSLLDEWEYDETADDVERRYERVLGSDEVAIVATNPRAQETMVDALESVSERDITRLENQVRKLRDRVEQSPQDTADELESRFK